MYDLVYDFGAWKDIEKAFPDAKIEDARDDVHVSRISVQLPDEKRTDYLKWMVWTGWGRASITLQSMVRDHKDRDQVKKWIEEVRAEHNVGERLDGSREYDGRSQGA